MDEFFVKGRLRIYGFSLLQEMLVVLSVRPSAYGMGILIIPEKRMVNMIFNRPRFSAPPIQTVKSVSNLPQVVQYLRSSQITISLAP